MNYHIMLQDKFLTSYIEDIYEIGEEKNNTFWFRGTKGESPYFTTNRPVEYLGNDIRDWEKKLSTILPTDNIFVHWYDMYIGSVVYNMPNKLFVFHWGGDFFSEPMWYQAFWLYDKKTLEYIKAKHGYPKLLWRKNIFKMWQQYLEIRKFKQDVYQLFEVKNKQMGRIDYVMCSGLNTSDLKKAKQLFPAFRAIHLSSTYDNNVDLALEQTNKQASNGPLHILLGNSADPTNNHLDAFEQLKKLDNIEIYCPLSYGDTDYRELVIKEGKKILGDKFIPVLEFMTRDSYIAFLNRMDIIYMYHNRSQAWGNIATSLTLSKPVFLKKGNSLNGFIQALGLNCYDAEKISSANLVDVINKEHGNGESNRMKLTAQLSKSKRLIDLKKIMTEYAK